MDEKEDVITKVMSLDEGCGAPTFQQLRSLL